MNPALSLWLTGVAVGAAVTPLVIRLAQTNTNQSPDDRIAIAELSDAWNSQTGRAATLLTQMIAWPLTIILLISEAISHAKNRTNRQ